jgi:hypothetical protein
MKGNDELIVLADKYIDGEINDSQFLESLVNILQNDTLPKDFNHLAEALSKMQMGKE